MVVRWIRSILTASKKVVGKDRLGNTYFETIKSSGKLQRSFEPGNSASHEQYKSGDLPHEWEAWLRGKRNDPPSLQEVEKNLQYATKVQVKAARKSFEDDKRQAEAYAEGLIQREPPTERPSVQKSTKSGNSTTPGTDKNYQPDVWTPGSS